MKKKNAHLTVLGSGGMMPKKDRYCPSFLFEYKKEKILLDAGHTVTAQL